MNKPADPILVDFRIPGTWSHPRELVQSLPAGCRVTGEHLLLEDGTQVEFSAVPADDQFADIFRASCRRPPTEQEQAAIDNYAVNVLLSGPGGMLEAAHSMMRAAAAMIRAGAAGVFIDNCGLAHGGQDWLAMTDDGSSDAISFAFVAILRGDSEVYTMGMHVLGLRDIVMKRKDAEDEGFDITEVIRYLAAGDKPVSNGHVLADLDGPRFQVIAQDRPAGHLPEAMRNPFGRFKLVNVKDIGEIN